MMPERLHQIEQPSLCRLRPLFFLWPLFAILAAAILLWGVETVRTPVGTLAKDLLPEREREEETAGLLVTLEQLERMHYMDSTLGEISWSVSEESLEELNRVLREYNITTAEEISQFLAQAAVETSGGRWLTELGEESYFRHRGYTTGTRGAGYFHLTYEYGQMAFSTWMMKRYIPELGEIVYLNPASHNKTEIREAYHRALWTAANLGLDVSRYSRIVYDPQSADITGADYISQTFAWESAAYYWQAAGVKNALSQLPGTANTDIASKLVGGSNWQSRREAYLAFYPVLNNQSK